MLENQQLGASAGMIARSDLVWEKRSLGIDFPITQKPLWDAPRNNPSISQILGTKALDNKAAICICLSL
jgi:hypothetical protein